MTPISTLSSRMLSFDGGMKKSVAEKIIADSLSIDLDQAPSQTLFGYDPIALMAGSDATQAAKAKPIYAANSLLMALGNASGALGVELGSLATTYINAQISTSLRRSRRDRSYPQSFFHRTRYYRDYVQLAIPHF